jgi:hypothetical protein
MSLSKSKCWYSNNCLHFIKRGVPLLLREKRLIERTSLISGDNTYNDNINTYNTSYRCHCLKLTLLLTDLNYKGLYLKQ